MSHSQYSRLVALLAVALLPAACRSFEVESTQIALIRVPTTRDGDQYNSAPSAFFIEGTNISLASTIVGQEGCFVRTLTPVPTNQNFTYLDAGASVTARFGGAPAEMTKRVDVDRTTYELPEGTSMSFTPGENITVTIPGAAGGFPARTISAPTAPAFTPGDITLPALETDNMTVTWEPTPTISGTAMFYSFKYANAGAILDKEIACVFTDDGSGVVPSAALTEYRASAVRSGAAQRGLITANRVGSAITHVTSVFEVPLVLNDIP